MFEQQLKQGVDEFNRGLFFECHDTLEELWMETAGEDRLFLQGLIQVSVGFYHFVNRNYKGATSQFTKGLAKLEHYRPSYRGIELEKFMQKVVGYLVQAERGVVGEKFDSIEETKIPRIQFIYRHNIKEM